MAVNGRKLLILLLLLAAGVEFSFRGPLRAARSASEWNDFLSPYIQAKAWIKGMNPYSTANFVLLWPSRRLAFVAKDAANGTLVAKHGVPSPYPLTSFVLLAPFSLAPWPAAQTVWMVLNLSAFVVLLGALISLAGLSWRKPRAQLFVAAGLALAPFHTGLATENPAVLVVGLGVGSVWAANRDWHKTAGILLGMALCMKPQVGLCFVLYYLIRRRWSIAGIACGWTAAITLIAVSRLAVSGVPWLSTYLDNNRSLSAPGAINDFTPANPVWHNMINLQVLLYQLARNASLANLLAFSLGALLLGVWLWLTMKNRSSSELLEISGLVVLSLLPVYHRFYDAALLIWPLAWSLMAANKPNRRPALLSVALILPFFVPGAAFLGRLAEAGRIPAAMTSSWWWNVFIMAHQAWVVLALGLVLLYAMTNTATAERDPAHLEAAAPVAPQQLG